jgi:hypothetical protein
MSTQLDQLDPSLEVDQYGAPVALNYVPPPFPTWPPPNGGAPFSGTELGPVTNPNPYGTTQPANISTANPAPPNLAVRYPQSGGVGVGGQNQMQLPKGTKPIEVGPIPAPTTISAISPTPIMGPGPQGTPPY